jgi:peroxiredoxin
MSEQANETPKREPPARPERRLQPGDEAPPFKGSNPQGRLVSFAEFRGKLTWLALFRYAACPFCNLRIHQLVNEQDRIKAADISLVAIFPSPAARVSTYIERYKPSFTIIADPDEIIHNLYHTETSWANELKAAANIPKAIKALAHAPNNPFAVDGPINRMPAEFLIDRQQRIAMSLYGTKLDDGFAIEDAIAWAQANRR